MLPHNEKNLRAAARSAPLFAALGDETRLRLVIRLGADGPLSITALTSGFPVTRQAVSRHLQVLNAAGLVSCSRAGRESIWQLDRQRFEQARSYLELISKRWDDALGRLREYVEQ